MRLVWLEEATSPRVKIGGVDFIPWASPEGLSPE